MYTKEEAHIKIASLVERFNDQREFYKNVEYNETLTRRDFIDPFWKALGWDIDNENGYAESYREVIHEDRIKIGGATKAPDYSFRLGGGKRLFFLEAKKPSVFIKDEILPAYQVRRYGWSAKMPISVISDFEEFAIYDCTTKPKPTDKASNGRIKYLTYDNYLSEFDFIWNTFSKERVLKGSFDKYVKNDKTKKGTTTVDHEFLNSLDNWRKELALNIALRNKSLGEDELNFVVQHFIDRIIFLRIAEDRSVEQYGGLKSAVSTGDFYQNLLQRFHSADQKYNSGLFDFQKDKISKSITIDNKVIKGIVNELYYPVSPYEFSVLSVEILGSAYEQFLGKQISLSKGGRATIEEKPEVRKAGGVYYTPQYIVDYIVDNAVMKIIDGKTPKEVSNIKIVDPACGSGSFLIGAYQKLLNWHKDYYTLQGKKSKGEKNNPLTPAGELTTEEKKRILLNNIYGVDLDSNAVEVTKLSLLLKCLEGETGASIETQSRLFHDRILPTLDNNIKSGNSLIDLDYYNNELDFGEERKIKPFNWQKAFPEVFKQGGFDGVIGNPPYRLMQPKDTDANVLKYFHHHYAVAEFKVDLFHLFYQQGIRLLKKNGYLGYITPSSILNNVYVKNLRLWLLENSRIDTIALTKEKVFLDADVFTAVFILEKTTDSKKVNSNLIRTTIELEKIRTSEQPVYSKILQTRFLKTEGIIWNILMNEENTSIIEKVNKDAILLKDLATINRGLITGDRKKFFSETKINKNYVPILAGGDIFRYYTNPSQEYVLFQKPKTAGGCWDEEVHFSPSKVLIRQIGIEPIASIIEKPIAVTGNVFTVRGASVLQEKFLLGIINSSLIRYYWKIMFSDFKNSFPQVTIFSLSLIPIKLSDQKTQDEIIKLVNLLVELHNERKNSILPNKLEQIQNRIEHAENKINQIVYQLYGLTQKEINIIEG